MRNLALLFKGLAVQGQTVEGASGPDGPDGPDGADRYAAQRTAGWRSARGSGMNRPGDSAGTVCGSLAPAGSRPGETRGRNTPIPEFGHRTAETLVAEGKTDAVIAYLMSIVAGSSG